ncbi:GMC oxidoreductase [Patellaria atrata CBS 101060]|uniref:GMC oxidoreductase n=1 Tax=Patellaria atrata CBS 101060 TaxID=1346257 RepID=A0A9P4SCB5_9PEZI|nr:GMC oxidoreductase [Patellaria atrata CBS 101060]
MYRSFSFLSYLLCLSFFSLIHNTGAWENNTYEYIVIGSGPGGGPVAANLARAGHSVLLLEAGDDQTQNVNVSLWYNFNLAGNDPATRWDFFVKHSDDPERESRYLRMTWRNKDGSFYVGTDPPAGAEQLGIYYPRAGTLGGCAMHNGCLTMNPNDADWDDIAKMTGDSSWTAENMRKYLINLERVHYLPNGTEGHGYTGWLDMTMLDSGLETNPDSKLFLQQAALASGASVDDLPELTMRDMNGDQPNRDQLTGIFGGVSHIAPNQNRSSPGYYVRNTVNENKYPLTLQLDTLATKIIFSNDTTKPKAIGVEFLQGKSMYSADPRFNASEKGTPGRAFASKEVIISGGAFNSPQLLKLSGIGPAEELKKFNIPVVVDLPGVGHRLADNYEAGILSLASRAIAGASEIFPVFLKTSVAKIRDIYMWCGSFSFEGFWPGFPESYGPSQYECAIVHMNPRSQAGAVTLRSADPRDVPDVNLNFFKTGESQDLQAILEAVKWVRGFVSKVGGGLGPFKEKHPCPYPKGNCTDEEQKKYIKEQAYSHHASSTCAIGADGDEMAVLDSKFRVRGVKGLRVVDASSFPAVPGGFPVLPTMMLSEKATEEILNELEEAGGVVRH